MDGSWGQAPHSPTMSPRNTRLDVNRLKSIGPELKRRICGQGEVLDRVTAAVLRRETTAVPDLGRDRCMVFAGPTGVGKTETAKHLASLVFGDGAFYRFDCGEFRTVESIAALLGNRLGDRGRFGEAVAAVPRGVWLFDELEKANPEFLPLLMAMTDAGRVTLANGETADLDPLYLIATTNLGSAEILGRNHLPFATLEQHVLRSIQRHFRPELVARFLPPFVFRPLDADSKRRIVLLHLRTCLEWHARQGRRLQAGMDVVNFLYLVGFSSKLGARPLVDAIYQHVGDAVVRSRLAGRAEAGRLAIVGMRLEIRS